jgi:hypothetical protein
VIHVQQPATLPFVVSFFHTETYTLLRWTGFVCHVLCIAVPLPFFHAGRYYVIEPAAITTTFFGFCIFIIHTSIFAVHEITTLQNFAIKTLLFGHFISSGFFVFTIFRELYLFLSSGIKVRIDMYLSEGASVNNWTT